MRLYQPIAKLIEYEPKPQRGTAKIAQFYPERFSLRVKLTLKLSVSKDEPQYCLSDVGILNHQFTFIVEMPFIHFGRSRYLPEMKYGLITIHHENNKRNLKNGFHSVQDNY